MKSRDFALAVVLSWSAAAEEPHIRAQAYLQSNFFQLAGPARNWPSDLGTIGAESGLRFTEATFSLSGNWNSIGFQVDGGDGDFYQLAMAGDRWRGLNRYVAQAYLYGNISAGRSIHWEAGKFFSSVGAEVPQSYLNFNISRSLLFWYGSPLYHTGARARTPVSENWTVGAQLLSGCNTMTGAHGHQTLAVTTSWAGKRWGWSQIYMGGNEKVEGRGWRHLSDNVFTFNPSRIVTGYAEFLGALERRTDGGLDRWYGCASSWRISPREHWSFSPRVEWYRDATGFTTGTRQTITEWTLTGDYRPRPWLIARLEYRADRSSTLSPRTRQALIAGITLLYRSAAQH